MSSHWVLCCGFCPGVLSHWKKLLVPLHTNTEDLFGFCCFRSKSSVILSVPWISALLRNSAFLNNFTVNGIFSCLYKCHWTVELTLARSTIETSLHCFLYSGWFYNKLCWNCIDEPFSNFTALHFGFMVFTYMNRVTLGRTACKDKVALIRYHYIARVFWRITFSSSLVLLLKDPGRIGK